MQRTAHRARLPFSVQRCRNVQRVRVELDDRVERRASAVNRLDTRQVVFGQLASRQRAGGELRLEIGDAEFVQGGLAFMGKNFVRGWRG